MAIDIGANINIGRRRAVTVSGGGCVPFSKIDGGVSQGATFTHPANGVVAWTITTLASVGSIEMALRSLDANNWWMIATEAAGNIRLYEKVAGSYTLRASALAVVSNGHRIATVCDDTTISVYSNNVLRITYGSASNFATATAGKLDFIGASGVVSNLKTWSLACRAMEGV